MFFCAVSHHSLLPFAGTGVLWVSNGRQVVPVLLKCWLFVVVCECQSLAARGMPRGRAWQHSDDLSYQAWLKVLQGSVLLPRSATSAVEASPAYASTTRPGQGERVAPGRPRSSGGRRQNSAKIARGLRKVRQQAQTPPVEVRVKLCEKCLERARKNVSKSQEEVAKAQQALTEAQNHAKLVDEVAQAEPEVNYPPDRGSQSLCSNGTSSGLGKRVAEVARESERIAASEPGAPGILQASSSGHVDLRGSTRTPF